MSTVGWLLLLNWAAMVAVHLIRYHKEIFIWLAELDFNHIQAIWFCISAAVTLFICIWWIPTPDISLK